MPEIFGGNILGGGNENNETGSLISRFEIARNDIINEFATISTDNGYRNNVVSVINAIRAPYKVTETPEIGVVLGTRSIRGEDDAWMVTSALCDVFVQAVVEEDEEMEDASQLLNDKLESIAHDMTRVLHGFFTSNINNIGRGRWNIVTSVPAKVTLGVDFGDKVSKGIVRMEFRIQLRSLGSDYD